MGKKPTPPELGIEDMLEALTKINSKLSQDKVNLKVKKSTIPEEQDEGNEWTLEHDHILTEGILFTNAIVDVIHGKIPENSDTHRKDYFH